MIGNYRVLKLLGEGGFGKTYLGEHAILEKKVVLKLSHFQGPAAQKIVMNEASLLWDVNHWALPTVKDVLVTDEGDLVMVMSYVPGEELAGHVKKNGPVDAETACWIAQRVLSALYYLHFAGIVHRDVKPANIIVNFKTHIATLVDFGLSKLKPDGSPDPSGYTPDFGAPEQVEGKPPLPESDIYALGMTLVYVLSGSVRPEALPDSLDPDLRDFVLRMLRRDPRGRPNCCKALNEELTRLREKMFQRAHTR